MPFQFNHSKSYASNFYTRGDIEFFVIGEKNTQQAKNPSMLNVPTVFHFPIKRDNNLKNDVICLQKIAKPIERRNIFYPSTWKMVDLRHNLNEKEKEKQNAIMTEKKKLQQQQRQKIWATHTDGGEEAISIFYGFSNGVK